MRFFARALLMAALGGPAALAQPIIIPLTPQREQPPPPPPSPVPVAPPEAGASGGESRPAAGKDDEAQPDRPAPAHGSEDGNR